MLYYMKKILKIIIISVIFIISMYNFSHAKQNLLYASSVINTNFPIMKLLRVSQVNGKNYLLSDKGKIINKTGLINYDGEKVYLINGEIVYSQWKCVNGSWYYLTVSGFAATGWKNIGGNKYYFTQDGIRVSGLQTINSKKYIFDKNGKLLYGWHVCNGFLYYQNKNGQVVKAKVKINNKQYIFKSNGIYATKGWLTLPEKTYYITNNLKVAKGFYTINNKQYYFTTGGGVRVTGLYKINEDLYYFSATGVLQKNIWKTIDGNKYYFGKNGKAVSGLKTIDNKQYLFSKNGVVLKGINEVNGKIYKSRSGGSIEDIIVKSNVVSFIDENGYAISVKEEACREWSNVIYDTYNGKNTQKWELIKNEDDTYRIKNVYSGMYLSTSNNLVKLYSLNSSGESFIINEGANGNVAISKALDSEKTISYIKVNAKPGDNLGIFSGIEYKWKKITASVDINDIHFVDDDKQISIINKKIKNKEQGEYQFTGSFKNNKYIDEYFYNQFICYTGQMYFMDYNKNTGIITFNLTRVSEYMAKKEYVLNALEKLSKISGIKATMNDREKVRQINKIICTRFNQTFSGTDMYEMMKNKRGGCLEHSRIVFFLCKKNKIPVQVLGLETKYKYDTGHAINRVKVDGIWYYCDTMWNHGTFGACEVGEDFLFMKTLGKDYTDRYSNAKSPSVIESYIN